MTTADKKDAARYRWLTGKGDDNEHYIGHRWDAAMREWDGADGTLGFDAVVDLLRRGETQHSNEQPSVETFKALLNALTVIEPHLDLLICYASTTSEYPPNEAIKQIRDFLKVVGHVGLEPTTRRLRVACSTN